MRVLLSVLLSVGLGLCVRAAGAALWGADEGRIAREIVAGKIVKDHFAMSGRTVDDSAKIICSDINT